MVLSVVDGRKSEENCEEWRKMKLKWREGCARQSTMAWRHKAVDRHRWYRTAIAETPVD